MKNSRRKKTAVGQCATEPMHCDEDSCTEEVPNEQVKDEAADAALLQNVKKMRDRMPVAPVTSDRSMKRCSSSVTFEDLLRGLRKIMPEEAQNIKKLRKKAPPLTPKIEKVHERKVKREMGFEKVKKTLNQWEDIVKTYKSANQLTFPIEKQDVKFYESYSKEDEDILSTFKKPTELEKEMAQLLKSSKVEQEMKEMERDDFKLTLGELISRRRMFAKLRAMYSYKMAKAWRQKKIKSKAYHRLLRRERLKKQIKDFERLQSTDPEAVLKQLEQLEKARAVERATLRHRNTGKWARNQLVQAKYNKEARVALSEQMKKNRELLEKRGALINKRMMSLGDDTDDDYDTDVDDGNVCEQTIEQQADGTEQDIENEYQKFVNEYVTYEQSQKKHHCSTSSYSEPKRQMQLETGDIKCPVVDSGAPAAASAEKTKRKKKCSKISKRKDKECVIGSGSCNEDKNHLASTTDIAQMFDNLEERLEHNVKRKLRHVENTDAKVVRFSKADNGKSKSSDCSSGSNQRNCYLVEETAAAAADCGSGKRRKQNANNKRALDLAAQSQVLDEARDVNTADKKSTSSTSITPDNYLKVKKIKALKSALPDSLGGGEDELDDDDDDVLDEEEIRKRIINEAFADDDVVEEFRKEKRKIEEEELSVVMPREKEKMPGWGSWTGGGTETLKGAGKAKDNRGGRRKLNKRLLFRIPTAPPRKDTNKGHVIIRQEKDPKFKQHLVNELPYPFESVKEFETCIRAPVGRDWVPETAHQDLIAPTVVTKLGTIIRPIDKGELIENKMKREKNNKIQKL